jgi:hypothetical protein
MLRPVRLAALALAASCSLAGAIAAEPRATAPINRANDELLRLSPADRAATLARAVSHYCIGTETFLMGIEISGAAAGNAYWSLRCAGGGAWAIQLSPFGEIVAIDCDSFNANGAGKQCFRKF